MIGAQKTILHNFKKSIVSPIEIIPEEEEAEYEDRPAWKDDMHARHREATLVDIEMEAPGG